MDATPPTRTAASAAITAFAMMATRPSPIAYRGRDQGVTKRRSGGAALRRAVCATRADQPS